MSIPVFAASSCWQNLDEIFSFKKVFIIVHTLISDSYIADSQKILEVDKQKITINGAKNNN